MWIISTFDPKFQKRTLSKNMERYGEDNIIHITKSKLFLWKKVLIPTIFITWFLITLLTLIIIYINVTWLAITFIMIVVGGWIIPMSKKLKLYIDYKMDFIIVTPRSLVRYNQEWFFKRISKTIDLKDIRSTSVRKSWLLSSIFDDGHLVFLSEAGETEDDEYMRACEIIFRYVKHPDKVNSNVNKLLAKF